MARIKNVEKLAKLIGGSVGQFSDGSGSWVSLEDDSFEMCFSFDGKGNNYEGVRISKKIYQVVDQEIIAHIETPK